MDFISYNLDIAHDTNINISSTPLVILLVVLVVLMIFYVFLIMMTVLYELFEDLVISVTQILYRKSNKNISRDCSSEKQINSISNNLEIDSNPVSIDLNVKDQDDVRINEKVQNKFDKLNEANNEESHIIAAKVQNIIQNEDAIDAKIHSKVDQLNGKRKIEIFLNKLNQFALQGILNHKKETEFKSPPILVI
jgi:hypothetical protein